MEPIKGSVPADADVLRYQLRRAITLMFKHHLDGLEDLIVEHDIALNKLAENLPAEYRQFIDLADYLTEEKADLLRKRILDRGNQTIRDLEEVLKGFTVTLR